MGGYAEPSQTERTGLFAELMAVSTNLSSSLGPRLAFAFAGLALGAGLILARAFFFGLEGSVAGVAGLLPFGYGYAAGMVAEILKDEFKPIDDVRGSAAYRAGVVVSLWKKFIAGA